MLLAAVPFGSQLAANEPVRWRVHSAFSEAHQEFGTLAAELALDLAVLSEQDMQLKVFQPGAFAASTAYLTAVSEGRIEAALGSPALHSGRPALALFGGWPAGPTLDGFLNWLNDGGGLALAQQLYRQENIHFLVCGIAPAAHDGWFLHDFNSTGQIAGLPVLADGLAARTLARLGARIVAADGPDFTALLESGEALAVFGSVRGRGYRDQLDARFKHRFAQAWVPAFSVIELLVNLPAWQALSDAQRLMVELTCETRLTRLRALGAGPARDTMPAALQADLTNALALEAAALAENDPDFALVWQQKPQVFR